MFSVFGTSQAPEAYEVGTRELSAVQGGGAAVARSQPKGQTAARHRRTDRSDILLPPRVRLPTKTVAEEADALTKTCLPPPSPRLRSPRRGPSPLRFFYTTVAIVALILFIIMIILLLLLRLYNNVRFNCIRSFLKLLL